MRILNATELLLALILVVLAPQLALGQENRGISYLGACQKTFPCDEAIRSFNGVRVIRTGWLANTFNKTCSCGDRILALPKPKIIRIHIANGSCLRLRRCGSYELFRGESVLSAEKKIEGGNLKFFKRFDKEVAKVRAQFAKASSDTKKLISPVLESNFHIRARKILLDRIMAQAPELAVVDNPMSGPCVPGIICEKHGDSPKLSENCIADMDGSDFRLGDINKFYDHASPCFMALVWGVENNCSRGGAFVDPRKRVCPRDSAYFSHLGMMIADE